MKSPGSFFSKLKLSIGLASCLFVVLGCNSNFLSAKPELSLTATGSEKTFLEKLYKSNTLLFWFNGEEAATTLEADTLKNHNSEFFADVEFVAGTPGILDKVSVPKTISIKPDANKLGLYSSPDVDIRLQETTIAMVLKPTAGNVFSFDPFDQSNEALVLSYSAATGFTGSFFTSPSDYYAAKVPTTYSDYVLVTLTLTKSASAPMIMTVNGKVAQAKAEGTTALPSLVNRTLFLGPDIAAPLNVKDFAVFRRELSLSELGAVIRQMAERNSLAGVSTDASLAWTGSLTDTGPIDPAFAEAKAIIATKCASCHTHGAWVGKNAQYFKTENLVVAKDPENSRLYYRITGSTGANGPKNMPASGTITGAEADKIKEWINSL